MKFDNAFLDEHGDLHLEKSTGEGSGYHIIIATDCMAELWSIPMYGGEERFEGHFDAIDKAVAVAESWT